MRKSSLISLVFAAVLILGSAFLYGASGEEDPTAKASVVPEHSDTRVGGVFFGTNKVLNLDQLEAEALSALRKGGHSLRERLECVVNVRVEGSNAGCAVYFWDRSAGMTYEVLFDRTGNVKQVWGGKIQHGPTDTPGLRRPIDGVKRTN